MTLGALSGGQSLRGEAGFPHAGSPQPTRRQRELPAILSGSPASRTRPSRGPRPVFCAPTAGDDVLPLSFPGRLSLCGLACALSGERLYAMRADHAGVDTWLAG